MCLPHSNIARPSQAKRSHPLRNGPLDSCSLTIFLFKFLGLLSLTVLLQHLVKLFRLDIDRSSPALGARALREVGAHAATGGSFSSPTWMPCLEAIGIAGLGIRQQYPASQRHTKVEDFIDVE
jgi:hypothetical protein